MRLLPYTRMLKYLKSGKIDFAIFFLSDNSASFSEKLFPMYDLDTVVGNKSLKIRYVNDYKNAILMLEKGHVDAIVAPKNI